MCGGTLLLMRRSALLDIYGVASPLSGDGALLLIGVVGLPLVAGAALLLLRGAPLILHVSVIGQVCASSWTRFMWQKPVLN